MKLEHIEVEDVPPEEPVPAPPEVETITMPEAAAGEPAALPDMQPDVLPPSAASKTPISSTQ